MAGRRDEYTQHCCPRGVRHIAGAVSDAAPVSTEQRGLALLRLAGSAMRQRRSGSRSASAAVWLLAVLSISCAAHRPPTLAERYVRHDKSEDEAQKKASSGKRAKAAQRESYERLAASIRAAVDA